MTHYEQSLTQDGKLIPYAWKVLEPTTPPPGCDEAFRIVAECSSERDAKRISESINTSDIAAQLTALNTTMSMILLQFERVCNAYDGTTIGVTQR